MHLKNDNEMNSNANIGTRLDVKPIAVKPLPSAFSATSAIDEATIIPSTSSAGSCASSTDSGVIITDNNRRICDNNHNKSPHANNVDIDRDNLNCNATSGNITIDNSNNNIANIYGDERRRSVESLKANKNITINTQIDKNSINIENVINVRRHRSSSGSKASSKNGSPAVSIRSNTISIISIDENAIDSSVVDSDSDSEGQHSGYVVKKLGQQTTYEPNHPNLPNINKGMQVLSQTISPGAIPPTAGPLSETILNGGVLATPVLGPPMPPNSAQIGSIALSNSTDVTFGDKHFYEGPVTIQQFLIDSRDKWKNGEGGNDNPAFAGDPENAEKSNDSSTPPETSYIFNFRRRAVIITGTVILLTILVGIAIVTANAFTKQTNRKTPRPDIGNGTLWVISKDEWNGEAEHDGVSELKLPVPRVIIAHTASTSCENKFQCDARVQSVQAFHIHSNGWGDIGYNFLVGGDGLVYEGRGWYKQGAHTLGYNKDSICIAFIGTFNVEVPTENDLKAAQLLIDEGVKLGVLTEDYRLYGARQLSATESPGKALYSIIMKWPHYSRHV
uniref:Peptidoglycan-recognition protein LC n=1 Tax=Zeugodacus cucurbitae TaxID=28588 RepID=A0A0A1XE07_ZEUCU